MKSPICVTNICVTNRKQTASFRIAGLMLAIAPLWLMLAAANTSAHAQTSDDVCQHDHHSPSPADWTQFHRDNMQRWNPYETVLGVNNVGGLQLKWKSIPSATTSSDYLVLARRGEWGGLCRLRRRQRVCAERQHRRQAVELCHRRPSVFPRPPWRMGWFMSAPTTATCMR